MRRHVAWLSLLLFAATASAQVPAPEPRAPSGIVPTYWVLMVTGENNGTPWMKTTTPETLGGTVKGTAPWSCSYPATLRGTDDGIGFEQMEVACGIGDAEAFVALRCSFRAKPKPGKVPGKQWKRSELQTLNLRRKGDSKSTITVSLRCDVDSAFATD